MKKTLFTLFCLSLLISISIAQGEKNIIEGSVLEKSTGKPIPYVNVFLKNSSVGASTNEDGYFIIKNAPRGTFEIVASAIGYVFDAKFIDVEDGKKQKINFRLKSKEYLLKNVVVQDEEDTEWQRYFEIFSEKFIGYSTNADECEIQNPFVLNFKKKGKWLHVRSEYPVKLRNNALGYDIEIELVYYNINLNGPDINFSYMPYFRKLKPEDEDQLEEWTENRNRAYYGSITHFLSSLAKEKTRENGFKFKPVRTILSPPGDMRILGYDEQKMYESQILDTLSVSERKLISYNTLKIVYTLEPQDRNFSNGSAGKDFGSRYSRGKQTSWIKLPLGHLYFDINGMRRREISKIDVYGYMAWERMADIVPDDYKPIEAE